MIVSVEEDGEKLTLKYYGYKDLETKRKAEVARLAPPGGAATLPPGKATVGWECEAMWVGDGQWYAAKVLGLVEHGYKVKFLKYGSEGDVPLEYLREKASGGGGGGGPVEEAGGGGGRPPKRERAEKAALEHKEFVIPDHLRLLPTDNEEDKARKRKKVKHLKAQWKERHGKNAEGGEDEEVQETKSWKDYLKKSKKPKGMGALKKGSIFQSPDTVDGRVGVVGSGAKMTEFQPRVFKPGKTGGAGARK